MCDTCVKGMSKSPADERKGVGDSALTQPPRTLREHQCNCAACVNKRYDRVYRVSMATWLDLQPNVVHVLWANTVDDTCSLLMCVMYCIFLLELILSAPTDLYSAYNYVHVSGSLLGTLKYLRYVHC